MVPVTFKESNVVFAENQPEYLPLPAHKSLDGRVVSCWRLSLLERLKVLFSGVVWFEVLTFNQPLQPQLPHVGNPFKPEPRDAHHD